MAGFGNEITSMALHGLDSPQADVFFRAKVAGLKGLQITYSLIWIQHEMNIESFGNVVGVTLSLRVLCWGSWLSLCPRALQQSVPCARGRRFIALLFPWYGHSECRLSSPLAA